MPSPTKASDLPAVFWARRPSTADTLSCGSSSARTSVIPIVAAISSATSRLSPVSMTTLETPTFLRETIAAGASARSRSEITI